MARKWSTVGRVGEVCFCIPELDKVCKSCEAKRKPETEFIEIPHPNLEGFGYTKADQDGFDGEKVSPEEHRFEWMIGEVMGDFGAEII